MSVDHVPLSAINHAAAAAAKADTIAAAIHRARLGARSCDPLSDGPSPDGAFWFLVGLNLGFKLWRAFAIGELASRAHGGTKASSLEWEKIAKPTSGVQLDLRLTAVSLNVRFGSKADMPSARAMSALPPKADTQVGNVRFVPIADIRANEDQFLISRVARFFGCAGAWRSLN
jgi:hypothetical protein